MTGEEKSKIEELQKKLYSRTAPDIRVRRHPKLHENSYDVHSDWDHPTEEMTEVRLNAQYEKHGMSFFTKLLIVSIIFFLGALGIGTYLVLKGSDLVSADNIDVTLSGPVSVAGGTSASFSAQILNKNSVQMQVVDLTVQFPSGTVDPTDPAKELKTFSKILPDIQPNGVDQHNFSAVFFGEQNSKKTIQVIVNYHVPGSSATFTKEKDFDILVTSSPINLTVNSFSEINSNQELSLDVTVSSNSNSVLKNLLLRADYPFGFSYESATPAALRDNKTWIVGDLQPGGKKVFHITGIIQGQDNEIRAFNFAVGVPDGGSAVAPTISTQYIAASQQITVKKPFLTMALALNGDDGNGDFVGAFDSTVGADITWLNNLPTAVTNAEIHVKLSGSVYDKLSIQPGSGYFNSANNEIVWNSITNPELTTIAPGGAGKISFRFVPRNLGSSNRLIQNPQMLLSLSAKANRPSEANVPQEINSSVSRVVKVASNIALSGQVVRSIGPFVNMGPIPPKAEQTTSYTIIWTIYNTTSTVDSAQVVASLPAYAKWLGNVSPTGAAISYDSTSGQVTWNIGNVPAYTGQGANKIQVAFQVAIDPGVDLVGTAPNIISDSTLTARDAFTSASLTSTIQSMNTRFSTDPAFQDGQQTVTK